MFGHVLPRFVDVLASQIIKGDSSKLSSKGLPSALSTALHDI
jgi:hypothetical protein